MNKLKISHYLWIAALISGALGVLGKYDLVIIKGLSNFSFELLLIGFVLLIVVRLVKK